MWTEAETKKRLCPLLSAVPGYSHCIGSKCAMWRWEKWLKGHKEFGPEWEENPARGYCGLAGKLPE